MHSTEDDHSVPKKRKLKVLKPDAAVNAAWCKVERPKDMDPSEVSKEEEKRLMELRKNWIKELTSNEEREDAESEQEGQEQGEPKNVSSGISSPGDELDDRLKGECERIIKELHESIDANARSLKEMTERYVLQMLKMLQNDSSEMDPER